mgnify:CR=1 FL=1
MPKITLTSYGAAGEVTGSCHLLTVDNFHLLIDCGLFQGGNINYQKNWQDFGFDPKDIDAVILTHAHLDHCGRLARLFGHGYSGPVFATPPTLDLATIVLEDNFKIIQEKNKKQKLSLLYTSTDLKKLYQNWQAVPYHQKQILNNNISFIFHNAGHILGSAIVEIKIGAKTIVFTGDIGATQMPLVKDVDYLPRADYVVMESTYGDRPHENNRDRNQKLISAVQKAALKHSTLLIAIFAIERTQDILKVLNDFYEKHLDFSVPVFLDSPMADEATNIYKKYIDYLNTDAQDSLKVDKDIFKFPHLKITNRIDDSKQINATHPPKIILSGSGMMEGGRIIHHLAHTAPDPKNQILFMGYQVPGTLGQQLLDGAFDFDYYGKRVEIKAGVDQIDGFSAHADLPALLAWLEHFQNQPKIFLVHGDKTVLPKFSQIIKAKLGLEAKALMPAQTIELK